MQINFDWKFIVIILVTLAGVIAPVWLWQADRHAKSMSVVIVSKTSLKPDISSKVEVKILVDNTPIDRPYLTVLKLSNDGSIPIPSTDFEEPLEIQMDDDTSIVRSQLTDSEPKDIQPKMTFDAKVIKIMPLLLNPNDNITFAVVTAGGSPKFTARARVAGISAVPLEDKITNSVSPIRKIFQFFIVPCLIFTYASLFITVLDFERYQLSKPIVIFEAISAGIGGVLLFKLLAKDFALSSMQIIEILMVTCIIMIAIAIFVNRRQDPEL
jgi:hypothetical protein